MRHKGGHRGSVRRTRWELRTGSLLLLAGSLAGAVQSCTFVIGPEPERDTSRDAEVDDHDANDADRDADREVDAPASDGGEDASPSGADASHSADAGDAATTPNDAAGSGLDASSTADASGDAGLDAAADATLPASDASDTGAADAEAAADADADAQPPASDCDAGNVTWYPDDDEDGYGRSNESVSACPQPGRKWSRKGGDCRDSDANVHPSQLTYFGAPYSLGNGKDSFDYDCSGGEDGDLGQAAFDGNCGLLNVAVCTSDGGYVERTDRTGNVNTWCGSVKLELCNSALLGCSKNSSTSQMPYRCR